MYLEVYVDVIFIINFIMDFILLATVKRILKYESSHLRICLGAGVGAAGACLFAVTPDINRLLRFLLAYFLLSYLMVRITFSRKSWRERIKAVVLLYISTFFLGGLLNGLYYYTGFGLYLADNSRLYLLLAFVSGTAGMLIFAGFLKKLRYKESELYPAELVFREKVVRAVGFMDTGNCLRDPYLGKPVIVTEYTVIEPLLTNSENTMLQKLLDNFEEGCSSGDFLEWKEAAGEILPIRLIPFHSVGKSGILPAFELDKVVLWEGEEETVREKVLTAVSRRKLSVRKDYQIILHKEVM
ncbi:sigma-E processing peptidase SpoIIGA [Anaerocolumna xylanovorans]|uniref:Sporulation sigma-E factor-processing peptidase n=1 Tax=Anaerocolumna xylanovorans DSM 12503 TaxID=1121345 RepID=A0A1M7YBG1_9FIRM|nr:sigma-E processing peptidase SpoIIGA [Anaerocolumna xylanovorans]SHO49942.1 stage II sporulation protein GA (sporulation sigma-E factor processing peptidase) [Anaerocolumna xylanovorans DSM 12503]